MGGCAPQAVSSSFILPSFPTAQQVSVLQSKIVRATDRVGTDGKARSRGFGFLQFEHHDEALAVLRGLNNNPEPFGPLKRPILMFAFENAQVIRKLLRKKEVAKVRVRQGSALSSRLL